MSRGSLTSLLILSVCIISALMLAGQYLSSNTETPIIESAFIANNSAPQRYNAFQSSTLTNKTPQNTLPSNKLPDWQDSPNIKQAQYVPRVLTDEATSNNDQRTDVEHAPSPPTTNLIDIWSWLPSAKPSVKQETKSDPLKDEIHIYGNSFGTLVKKFTSTAGDQVQIMSDFVAGRGKHGNTDALVRLGSQYIELADSLSKLTPPPGFSSTSEALIRLYKEVGEASLMLAQATTDDTATVSLIYSYNDVVGEFAQKFITFSSTFGAYGVTFTKGEGGDILMPSL